MASVRQQRTAQAETRENSKPQPTSAAEGEQNDQDAVNNSTLLQFEKIVCLGLMQRLFEADLAQSFFNSFFPLHTSVPQFLEDVKEQYTQETTVVETPLPADPQPQVITEEVWCRFNVTGLVDRHYARDPMPPIHIDLVQLDGSSIPRKFEQGATRPLEDMRIVVSLFNKWKEVTQEVIPALQRVQTLVDGHIVLRDLMFNDISLRHGGFFVLTVAALDYADEVLAWRSSKIIVQSAKTHANIKRKRMTGTPETCDPDMDDIFSTQAQPPQPPQQHIPPPRTQHTHSSAPTLHSQSRSNTVPININTNANSNGNNTGNNTATPTTSTSLHPFSVLQSPASSVSSARSSMLPRNTAPTS